MEIFTVRMPALFDAMLGDPRLLSTAGKLADARPHSQQGGALNMLSETSRQFCAVLAAHLVEQRLDALQVRSRMQDAAAMHADVFWWQILRVLHAVPHLLRFYPVRITAFRPPSRISSFCWINPHPDAGLQDPESPAAVLVLRLFAIVFEVMAKYNVKTDDILLPVFPRLIARTQELAAAATNPSGATRSYHMKAQVRLVINAPAAFPVCIGVSRLQPTRAYDPQVSRVLPCAVIGRTAYHVPACLPAGFLRLQVTLFRTISSGKFMDIYNAFAAGPLLVDTINFLTAMLHTPASQADKVPEETPPFYP